MYQFDFVSAKPTSGKKSGAAGDTREALLDAAEDLLAVKGVAGTSIRDIIKAAGTNLGAVTYHFGSKDRLVMEVFVRRMRPLDQERLARLDDLEKNAGPDGPKLEQILDALIRPLVDAQGAGGKQATIMRLIGRGFQEVDPQVRELAFKDLGELARRFDRAFLRAVPHLPEDQLFWRITFMVGALHFALDAWTDFDQRPSFDSAVNTRRLDSEEFIRMAVTFIAAGFSTVSPL